MTNKKYFYVSRDSVLKGITVTYKITDEPIEDWNEDYFPQGKSLVYYGTQVPFYVVLDKETGEIREKTRTELYKEGLTELRQGEIFFNDEIIYIYKDGLPPEELIKPEYEPETSTWIERATDEEIAHANRVRAIKFYDAELILYNYVRVDYELKLVNYDEFETAKQYILSINPFYNVQNAKPVFARPRVFDRYLVS